MTPDESGSRDGKHYTEWVETVKLLKREGRLDEAVDLLGQLVAATENEARRNAGWGVAPWYYEQLAIIHAKRGESDAELEILERYAEQPHAPGNSPAKMTERLKKARSRRR